MEKFVRGLVTQNEWSQEALVREVTEVLLRPLAGVGADLLCLKARLGRAVGQSRAGEECP